MKNKIYTLLVSACFTILLVHCSGSTTTSATSASTTTTTTSTPCVSTPYTLSVTASSSGTVSHNARADCLQSGCHSGTTTANLFTVAGTMVTGIGSTTKAAAGSQITQVGAIPLTLTVDQCGNFYSSTAVTSLTTSRPTTTASTGAGGMLGASWTAPFVVATPQSCNSANCHDGASGRNFVY